MLRPCAILGVLFAVATFTLPAVASGDSPVDTSNRYEPQVEIERILKSERTDKAKLVALARFVRIGDTEEKLQRRLGDARQWDRTEKKLCYYQSGLLVVILGRKSYRHRLLR